MTIERRFDLEGTPELDIRIQSGRVELVAGRPGTVTVTVETEDTEGFIVEQRGSLILVSSDKDSHWLSRSSALVTIHTPEAADVSIATASAHVECRVPLRHADIKTASGDVDLDTVGAADIKTASGDVRIRSTTVTLKLKTASGDLFVTEGCDGSASLASASGDVRVNTAGASLDISTVSGDVFVPRFTGPKASMRTMSGDIRIGVPPGTSVDLDASLLSGKLHLPESPGDRPSPQRHMSIKAKLVSGDLHLNRVE